MDINNFTIKELKKHLQNKKITEELIQKLKQDSRKGVKKLAAKYRRKKEKIKTQKEKWQKMNQKIINLKQKGYKYIAGIDEAGRGPLAGPVVAGAVILNPSQEILGLDDSKKIPYKKREELFDIIKEKAVAVGIGIINSEIIDEVNIHNAAFLAMKSAVNDLKVNPDYLLIDGNKKIPDIKIEQEEITEGDARITNIAAGSIIAKVTRDRIIEKYHQDYPEYGFKDNKGYGTKKHIQALKEIGPTPIHRYSYQVVSENKKQKEN